MLACLYHTDNYSINQDNCQNIDIYIGKLYSHNDSFVQ